MSKECAGNLNGSATPVGVVATAVVWHDLHYFMVDMRYYKVTLCQQRGASQLMRVEICWRDHKSRCDDTRDRNWRMCQTPQTCYIEFDLQCDLICQRRISEQLVGLFKCSIFCGDSVDWQEAVSNLQQATPTTGVTMVSERLETLDICFNATISHSFRALRPEPW